jgi:hypothetical protein
MNAPFKEAFGIRAAKEVKGGFAAMQFLYRHPIRTVVENKGQWTAVQCNNRHPVMLPAIVAMKYQS